MENMEKELSLRVLELIDEVLPQTKLANSQKLKGILAQCRKMMQSGTGKTGSV